MKQVTQPCLNLMGHVAERRELEIWVRNRNTYHEVIYLYLCSVTKSCPTLCNPRDYSPPGSSVHWIFQAQILEWVAISYSRASSWPKDPKHVSYISCIGRQILYHCATWEALQNVLNTHLHSWQQLYLEKTLAQEKGLVTLGMVDTYVFLYPPCTFLIF